MLSMEWSSPHLSLAAQLSAVQIKSDIGVFLLAQKHKRAMELRWCVLSTGNPRMFCPPSINSTLSWLLFSQPSSSGGFQTWPDRDDNQISRNLLITKQIPDELGSASYKLDNFIDFGDWIFFGVDQVLMSGAASSERESCNKIYLLNSSCLLSLDSWDV